MLHTLFPLPGYLDDQCGKFLQSCMAYLDFGEFPNLIEYYSSVGNGTLLNEEYNTIETIHYLRTSTI